jgi:hypothetical protein
MENTKTLQINQDTSSEPTQKTADAKIKTSIQETPQKPEQQQYSNRLQHILNQYTVDDEAKQDKKYEWWSKNVPHFINQEFGTTVEYEEDDDNKYHKQKAMYLADLFTENESLRRICLHEQEIKKLTKETQTKEIHKAIKARKEEIKNNKAFLRNFYNNKSFFKIL